MAHHDVELVAVHDEKAPAVGGLDLGVAHDLDAAEAEADELTGEFVVVAGHEHHARAAPDLAQQLLDDVVVALRPVEAGAHAPAVDDVAHQIESIGVVVAKKIQDHLGLAPPRAQMKIGQKNRPIAAGGRRNLKLARAGHGVASVSWRKSAPFGQISMSAG